MTKITTEQTFDLKISFTTALGAPATATGITWANSAPTVIQTGYDGFTCYVTALTPGTAVITVNALTNSGKPISGAYNVVVEQAEATLIVFVAGEVKLKQV